MSIDPATGHVDFAYPWRSRTRESVNASCPVVFGNKVLISASYRTGSSLVEVLPNFTYRVRWTTQEFGLHFNTAIYRDGYLYGFDGRNEPDASLACVDASNGKVVWRETPEWTERIETGDGGTGRGHGTVPRVAAGGRRSIPVHRRAGPPALAGSDAARLSGSLAWHGCSPRANPGRCPCSAGDCCTSCRTPVTSGTAPVRDCCATT